MKREFTLSAFIALTSVLTALAAPFTPGDLVIERVGDGSAALTSAANPVFLDEYTRAGVLVQTISIPSSGASAVVNSGTATSEGNLTLSADGRELVIAGYNADAGTTNVAKSAAATTPRVLATVDDKGVFALGPNAGTDFDANNIRSGASDGKGNFWAAGANSGTLYLTNGQPPVVVQAATANTRTIEIFGGKLYFSSSSGSAKGVYYLGALPTGAATPSLIAADGNSAYDFAVSPDTNTIYVADDSAIASGGGVLKFTNGPSGYALDYILTNGLSVSGARSLAVDFTGSAPVIYAVTVSNTVASVTDTDANAVFSVVVAGEANTALRGVKFAPIGTPAVGGAFALGNLAVVRVGGAGEFVSSSDLGNSVHIDEFTTGGTLLNTINLPTNGQNAFALDSSTTEGYLTLSENHNSLVLAGYNTPLPSPSASFGISGTTSTLVPRAVATIDGYGNYALPIVNSQAYSTWNVSSAAFDGTNNFWMAGQSNADTALIGVIYAGTPGAPTSVEVCTNANRASVLNIFDGSFFVGSSYAPNGIYQILNTNTPAAPLPESFNQATPVIPLPGGSRNTDFAFDPAMTTCYYADTSIGIVKFTNNGGTWVSNYTISTVTPGFTTKGAVGLTVDFSQNPSVVYATTAESSGNRLIKLIDTGTNATPTLLAQAFTNHLDTTNVFRGVRFTPGQAPLITTAPVATNVFTGQNANFSVSASGSPLLAYQWYSNDVAIPWGTGASITITNASTANAGSYYVTVANGFGTASSAPVALSVNASTDPDITFEPMGLTNAPGFSTNLTVTATGTGPLTYQWLSNGVAIAGANSASYAIPAGPANYTLYSVIVSNSLGASVTSAPVIVEITPDLIVDDFSYPNGNITNSGYWFRHSGTSGDSLVTNIVTDGVSNGMYVVSQKRTDDVHRFLSVPQSSGQVYASFTINMKTLPANAGGTYFAHFCDTNLTSGFFARVFAMTTNAFPGTYRLGIANEQGDSTGAAGTGPFYTFDLDLATNIPYEVVVMYDIDNNGAQLWVNPASQSDSSTPVTFDTGTFHPTPTGPISTFDFRQANGEGISYIDTLRVATSFADVATNAPAVPIIGLQPQPYTNFAGNSATLEVAASGIGLTYDWQLNGTSLGAPSQPTLELGNLTAVQSGSYTVVVSSSAGATTSAVAYVNINGTPTAPFFTHQPQGVTNSIGGTAILSAAAEGTGPLNYQWQVDHGAGPQPLSDGGEFSGSTTPRLVISGLTLPDSGTYTVVATGGAGSTTSDPAIVFVTPPKAVSIAFLRSLEDPVTTQPSDTTTIYQVTGTITTATNTTSGNTASYYVQDATGGIDVFITGNSNFRPAQGEILTAAGVLASFNGELELDIVDGNPAEPYGVLTNSDHLPIVTPLPRPVVLPLDFLTPAHVPYLISNLDGSLAMATNLTLSNWPAAPTFADSGAYTYTNGQGSIVLHVSTQPTNFLGTNVPPFLYSLTGPFITNSSLKTWQIEMTSFSQLVTNPPPAVSISPAGSAANPILTWNATPYSYAYTVLGSTNVTGPYNPVGGGPISSAMVFTNGTGSFNGSNAGTIFYQVVSP